MLKETVGRNTKRKKLKIQHEREMQHPRSSNLFDLFN